MAKKKVKLNKNESENLMPVIREFNKIASAVNALLGQRVQSKERKISVIVSRIKRPDEKSSQIKVKTVELGRGYENSPTPPTLTFFNNVIVTNISGTFIATQSVTSSSGGSGTIVSLDSDRGLLKIKDVSMLERCINLIEKLGIQKIFIN